MVCSRVHDERPSCSTSGGQSCGGCKDDVAAAGGVVVVMVLGVVVCSLAICVQALTDVQERQLYIGVQLEDQPCDYQ